ncbi:MAG TPA: hypothetical protein VK465_09920 [Fibrobacteria bacterium]|nr:hypothetical protein [Fibrobacteria bacterium]
MVYRILPREIGRENEIFKTPFTLPCDSMVVPVGDTTLIHGNTLVHFGSDPSPSSRIHVHGRLVIHGDTNRPVYFSASVRLSESGGYIPGNRIWDGIEVAETGQIESRHARFFHAPTSILSRSRNVFMESSYFRGSSGLILPDTSVRLATQGAVLKVLDLRSSRPEITGHLDAMPQNKLTDKQAHSTAEVSTKSQSRWIYYSLGVISVAAMAGITSWILSNDEPTSSNPPIPNPPILSLDPDPTLPGLPPPR